LISEGALDFLQRLCDEAVAQHGSDVPRIERHVAEALAALPPAEREAFHAALSQFLAVQRALGTSSPRSRALN
jgi:hypothetical protein